MAGIATQIAPKELGDIKVITINVISTAFVAYVSHGDHADDIAGMGEGATLEAAVRAAIDDADR